MERERERENTEARLCPKNTAVNEKYVTNLKH